MLHQQLVRVSAGRYRLLHAGGSRRQSSWLSLSTSSLKAACCACRAVSSSDRRSSCSDRDFRCVRSGFAAQWRPAPRPYAHQRTGHRRTALFGEQRRDAGKQGRLVLRISSSSITVSSAAVKRLAGFCLRFASGLWAALALNVSISVPRLAGSSVAAGPTRLCPYQRTSG